MLPRRKYAKAQKELYSLLTTMDNHNMINLANLTIAYCSETLKSLNDKHYQEIKESGYFWLERDINRSVEETVELVAKHFGMR